MRLPHGNDPVSLSSRVEAVIDEVLDGRQGPRTSRHKKISRRALQETVEGIWVVAIGLRRSFLLEAVQLDEKDCIAIGECFQRLPELRHLIMVYESTSGSAFALNLDLHRDLRVKPDAGVALRPVKIDVSLPGLDIEELDLSSNRYLILLDEQLLTRSGTAVLALDQPEDFPEFAGILLEYPVIYSLSASIVGGSTHLDGAPLTLVKLWLVRPGSQPILLLSFTCPQIIESRISLQSLPMATKTLFADRIVKAVDSGRLTSEEGLDTDVTVETITLERAVL